MNIFHNLTSSLQGSLTSVLLFFATGSILLYFLVRWVLIALVKPLFEKTPTKFDDILLENKVIHHISLLIPVLFFLMGINLNIDTSSKYQVTLERISVSAIILIITLTISSMINALVDLSQHHPSTKDKPFKSIAQAAQVILFAVCIVLILSTMLNQSPWVFLSGVGAMTAVILLVFKDSILGLVAGIQLSALDMVRVGDWIEVPSQKVDGDVMDINLNTVKVRNFDKTITMIPPYVLISQSFKNYRGMIDEGVRRIKRSIYLDQSSICFANAQNLEQWKKITLLQHYLQDKEEEINCNKQNLENHARLPLNQRNLTNLGTFRMYTQLYLQQHPDIEQNHTLLVRQLQPTPEGIPIEIYTFTNTSEWLRFEQIQSDIFDHLLSSVETFGLRLHQNPTGFDLRAFGKETHA